MADELETAVVEVAKRRGRPPKVETPAPVVSQADLDRVLESFLGKSEVMAMRQTGSYAPVFERYRTLVEQALVWEAQKPCGFCHQRPGMNPLTGRWVRSWDQASKKFIEGHRIDCQRPRERR